MKLTILISALIISGLLTLSYAIFVKKNKGVRNPKLSVYDFSVNDIKGNKVHLSKYKDSVLLIVNTASKCGFTPQFEGLQKLYDQYKGKGLVILGFPCNQFMNQDPGSNDEIVEFCQLNYGVSFPMFDKIDVNGDAAHPLYEYLKSNVPNEKYKSIKWNFTKFLVDKNGKPVKRYGSMTKPQKIEKDILKLLK